MADSKLTALEQSLIDEVSSDYLMDATRAIAQWERLSGSVEEAEAFDWIERELDRHGLEVRRYSHPALTSWPEEASLQLTSQDGTEWNLSCSTHAFAASTGSQGVSGELLYVGVPTEENLRRTDVAGKIVLLDGIVTPQSNRVVELFDVRGSVWIAGERLHERGLSPVWGTPTPETAHLLPATSSVSIVAEDGSRLKQAMDQGRVQALLRTSVYRAWNQLPLLTGELRPANELSSADQYVLFSGHVDSWYHGAMDNGTANATMLEVAQILADHRDELRRGVRFAFWSGHSHTRYAGSAWYADHFWNDLHRHCVAHVNVDSVGGRGATILSEGNSMAELREFTSNAIDAIAGQRLSPRRYGRSGDQSFWGHGIPATLMSLSEQPTEAADPALAALHHHISGGHSRSGGLGWWWHMPDDLPDKIDPDLLVRDASIYLLILHRLATYPILPLDYRLSVRELQEQVESLQHSAQDRIRLDPLPELLTELGQKLDRVYRAIHNDAQEPGKVDRINAALMCLGRTLIPVNYTLTGEFGHDLAIPTQPLPGLAGARLLTNLEPESDDFRFLQTKLVRERNRAEQSFREALDVVYELLETLGDA